MSEVAPEAEVPVRRSRMVAGAPLFYGWFVVLAGTLGLVMTVPGQTTGVSIFIDHLIADLGLSRSGVSTLYLLGTLGGSLALPFFGRLVDRRGPRLAVTVIAAAFALACVWMGAVRGAVMLLVGFTLVRGLGQGALSLVSLHAIAIWFVRRRGVAIGLAGVGMAAATATFPTIIESLIEATGWRLAYMLLGLAVALTILPVGALVFRDRPERYGVLPDGDSAREAATVDERHERNYTAAQARRTLTYWVFVVGMLFTSALGTGLVFHHYSILGAGGLERVLAARTFVFYGATSAVTNLLAGALITRVAPRYLLAVMLAALGASLVFAAVLSDPRAIVPYGLLLGVWAGLHGSLTGNVFAYYFGRRHLGSIRGAASAILVVGSAVGPLVFALGYDLLGSYSLTLAITAVPPLALAVVVPWLRLVRDGVVR